MLRSAPWEMTFVSKDQQLLDGFKEWNSRKSMDYMSNIHISR